MCLELASLGCRVVVASRDLGKCTAAAEDIKLAVKSEHVVARKCNIRVEDEVCVARIADTGRGGLPAWRDSVGVATEQCMHVAVGAAGRQLDGFHRPAVRSPGFFGAA